MYAVSLARHRLDADLRVRVLHQWSRQRAIGGAESFERPERVDARQLLVGRPGQRLQRRHHRLVLLQHQQLLRGVAPPAVRIAEVRHQLRRGLAEHLRRRRAPSHAIVGQPPDAAVADDLVEPVLIDAVAQIRARARPLRLLDDAAIHVSDVQRAVRRGRDVDGPEEWIGGPDELREWIDVLNLRQPLRS